MAGRKGKRDAREAGGRPDPRTARHAGRGRDDAPAADKARADRTGTAKGATERTGQASGHLLYGLHAVGAALANPARTIHDVWVTPGADKRLDWPSTRSGRPRSTSPAEIDAMLPDAVHQGVAARVEPLPMLGIEDTERMTRVVVLDQITDPHNLGAILRSAAAFGIEALVTTERHAPAATGLVAKTASGALERVPLVRVTNLARALDALKDTGFFCVGLAGEASADLEDAVAGATKLALVMGAEGPGLRRLTRERCDVLARIPMTHAIESLNVSNAAAIAFYAAARAASAPDTVAPRPERD